jgi:hypothetical protein
VSITEDANHVGGDIDAAFMKKVLHHPIPTNFIEKK